MDIQLSAPAAWVQVLCSTEPAAPAGLESTTGIFRVHILKGNIRLQDVLSSVGNNTFALRSEKEYVLWMTVTANNSSCLLKEQRIWGISVQVSSSIQRPEKEMFWMFLEKENKSIQVLDFEIDQSSQSYFLKFSQLLVSPKTFELHSLISLYITWCVFLLLYNKGAT